MIVKIRNWHPLCGPLCDECKERCTSKSVAVLLSGVLFNLCARCGKELARRLSRGVSQ